MAAEEQNGDAIRMQKTLGFGNVLPSSRRWKN
jgi:hypothetical protein